MGVVEWMWLWMGKSGSHSFPHPLPYPTVTHSHPHRHTLHPCQFTHQSAPASSLPFPPFTQIPVIRALSISFARTPTAKFQVRTKGTPLPAFVLTWISNIITEMVLEWFVWPERVVVPIDTSGEAMIEGVCNCDGGGAPPVPAFTLEPQPTPLTPPHSPSPTPPHCTPLTPFTPHSPHKHPTHLPPPLSVPAFTLEPHPLGVILVKVKSLELMEGVHANAIFSKRRRVRLKMWTRAGGSRASTISAVPHRISAIGEIRGGGEVDGTGSSRGGVIGGYHFCHSPFASPFLSPGQAGQHFEFVVKEPASEPLVRYAGFEYTRMY